MATTSHKKAVKPVKKAKTPVKSAAKSGAAKSSRSAKKSTTLSAFNPTTHELVPKHEKVSAKEAKEIRERYHVTLRELPKISVNDPAIAGLGLQQGDIVKITRTSRTAGETVFYRGVIDE